MPQGQYDLDRIFTRDGSKVQFELTSIDYEKEFLEANRRKITKPSSEEASDDAAEEAEVEYEDVEPIVFIKAVNVMSDGLDFLELTEQTQSFAPQMTISEDDYTSRSQFNSKPGTFQMDREDNSEKEESLMDDDALFDEEEEYK